MPITSEQRGSTNWPELVNRLHTLPYFRNVSGERLSHLAQQAVLHPFTPGEMLIVHDEPSAGLWIIEQGWVKVIRINAEGREYILRLCGPGESLNEIPALDDGLNPAAVFALNTGKAWILSNKVLQAEIRADPDLAQATIQTLARLVRHLVNQVESVALHSVISRVARYLLQPESAEVLSVPEVSRITLAQHLATTPESISRALRSLRELGAIDFNRQTITVIDVAILESIAVDDDLPEGG